ncbi:hypothetical protein [Crystallibacter degradans]|uniref:hypothetical protein n=1 Tax=Crystallibacter degradans TaxID=2726743 RepID=UPI001474C01C|nr:hypothetical protein [Arthrobacter sp. SF27]NMR28112.1 hypothetical protein [Arthrobacter sp. SF27]
MIRHQLVQWILLPNGLTSDGFLAASVFIAPRLRPGQAATLADFPDFADWPDLLRELTLNLERGDGATTAPRQVMVQGSSQLWQALFVPTTTVRAFAFDDFADRPLVSYPVKEVLGHLRNRWATLAARTVDDLPLTSSNASPMDSGQEHRDAPVLAEHFEELLHVGRMDVFEGVRNGEQLSARLEERLRDSAAQARELRLQHSHQPQELIRPFGSGGSPAGAFYALAGFHARPAREPADLPTDREQARAALEEKLDFHDHLSSLGGHPAVLRGLGLVLDLVVDPGFVPVTSDNDPPTMLRLRVERPSAFPAREDPNAESWNCDVTPWTSCQLAEIEGSAFFNAAERTQRRDFTHGFLHLDPQRYEAAAVDVDGLALKALKMAATLQNQENREQRPLEEPERDGVPAARTGGVALVHAGQAEDLHNDFYQARANNDILEQDPDHPPVLAAEDLIRGYRMDIWAAGHWRSLHQRQMTYTPARDPGLSFDTDDEGSIELSLTGDMGSTGQPADPDGALYAHETLVTWDGWSLSVPRPGEAVLQEPPAPEAGTDIGSMQLSISTSPAPETLPRLRFQDRYRTRLRVVDMAGNSYSLPDASSFSDILDGTGRPEYVTTAPSDALPYLRFEPVPPPELVPRHPFNPGEGLERLVIRSTPGQSASDYARSSEAAAGTAYSFRDFCDRHLAAAKSSLQVWETHGMLDEAIDAARGMPAPEAESRVQGFYDIAVRESGTFRDSLGAEFNATGSHNGEPQGYVTIDADAVDLPYLPDPLCAGAKIRVRLHPGEAETVLDVPFSFAAGAGLHQPSPLRLRLEEGDYHAGYDGNLVTVRLPAGRTCRLRLSSLLGGDPDLLGIMGWCRSELGQTESDVVYEAIRNSTHWMTTPWRDLVLVHAVQRPLDPPSLALNAIDFHGFRALARNRGGTAADLEGELDFDLASTAQLDLFASWDDVVDDPQKKYPTAQHMVHSVHRDVFSLPVPEPFGTPWIPEVAPLIEPRDERTVAFRTRGWENESPESRRLQLLADSAQPGLPAVERRRLEAGASQLEKLRSHEFGDPRYRRVSYLPTAATRFREYFDPAMPAADGQAAGVPVTVDILNSAPPAKPVVQQVLPLMGYAQTRENGDGITSTRSALGLRVWLARPWFSSGAGEKLAVVCNGGGPLTYESAQAREITFIAQDPAHGSPMPQPLTARSFPTADAPPWGQVIVSGHTSDTALFTPQWDEDSDAWYCDIQFDTGTAYFPFVRLGLARYQPMSVPGCEMSPIIPTAFVQTVPNRSLTTFPAADGTIAVSLTGPAPSSYRDAQGSTIAGTNLVTAVVEEQDLRIEDPYIGWEPVGAETELVALVNQDGTTTWSGAVQVLDPEERKLRLAVHEYELHPADDLSAEPPANLVASRRLVHADVVPL